MPFLRIAEDLVQYCIKYVQDAIKLMLIVAIRGHVVAL